MSQRNSTPVMLLLKIQLSLSLMVKTICHLMGWLLMRLILMKPLPLLLSVVANGDSLEDVNGEEG